MNTYLVKRHGSNAANQPGQQESTLGFVTAIDEESAEKIVRLQETVYNNQHLELIPESEADMDEWNYAAENDAPHWKQATSHVTAPNAVIV